MSGEITVLLGLFDGLHLGHMSAVRELLRQNGKKAVFTFDSASMTTKGERGLLYTDAEKRQRLIELGVDEVISRDFGEIKDIPPHEFVESTLHGELNANTVICGENFRFGKGGRATADDLKDICCEYGIDAVIVPTVCLGGEPISTTRIRRLIESGDIESANALLGYPYSFEGVIAHGSRIGTQMGIKTVNIPFEPQRVLPKKGVYMSRAVIGGQGYAGVTNIGTRPTVHDGGEVVIETHILDFNGEVYGESVKIELLKFMREEKRFGSLEELRETVANDINDARKFAVDRG